MKLLAVDLKKFIGKVEAYKGEGKVNVELEKQYVDEFKELKKTIVNYYTMAKKYKEKFLEGL